MTYRLDRMAIEEVGANPARLAGAIHAQIGAGIGAVLVHDIAHALGIVEIRVESLQNLEGALIAPPERGHGSILVNDVPASRQRFTIAHELGHYLSPHHEQTDGSGFWCNKNDLRTRGGADQNRHARQEAEANTFAIELLAPRIRTRPYLGAAPDLAMALAMSNWLQISREAGVRRYVEHHAETLAVVFSHNGRVRYTQRGSSFPTSRFTAITSCRNCPLLHRMASAASRAQTLANGWRSQLKSSLPSRRCISATVGPPPCSTCRPMATQTTKSRTASTATRDLADRTGLILVGEARVACLLNDVGPSGACNGSAQSHKIVFAAIIK